jgi:single-strand DNA-binding protein
MYINTGRIGKDLELKYAGENNTPVANFSVAFSYGFGEKKRTEWFNVVAWGKRAETLVKYCRKGDNITLFLTPFTREWIDKENNKRKTMDWNVEDFQILTFHNEEATQGESESPFYPIEDEGLPF